MIHWLAALLGDRIPCGGMCYVTCKILRAKIMHFILTDLMDFHIIWPKESAMWEWQRLQNELEKPSCHKAVKAIIWQSCPQ